MAVDVLRQRMDYWSSVAPTWAGWFFPHPVMGQRSRELNLTAEAIYQETRQINAVLSRDGARGINLGAGASGLAAYCFGKRAVRNTIDGDIAWGMLTEEKPPYYEDSSRVQLDAAAVLPFAKNVFDAATAFFLHRYLSWDEQQMMLREAIRVLKPNSRLLFIDYAQTPAHPMAVSEFDPARLVEPVRGDFDVVRVEQIAPARDVPLGSAFYHGPTLMLSGIVVG